MKEPFIYTMPESFMKDHEVPARWRVLGLVNGFAINGKPCYASNEWFMEKLGCSQQTVTTAIKELEELGEITTERTSTTRIVFRKGTNQLVGGYKPVRVSDPNQLVPNSVSNSVNIHTAQSADFSIEEEGTPKKPPSKATAEYEEGLQWAEKRSGRKFVNRVKQYSALKKAKANNISVEQLVRRWKELESEPFYQEHGLDWMMVLSSFDKRV